MAGLKMQERGRVLLVDTSLGDSGFGVAAALSANEKLELAAQLARLGVDGIVAGFPMGSPGDFAAVQALAELAAGWAEGPVLTALARPLAADVDTCVRALGVVRRARISVVCPPPPAERAADQAGPGSHGEAEDPWVALLAAVARARAYFDVQVAVQDVLRWPGEQLHKLILRAVDAGAGICVLVDSTGYGLPEEIGSAVRLAVQAASGRAVIGIHPHDDLGLATANALAAIQAGAGLVEGTMMGVGERAGNAALEEVAMILRARGANLPFETAIRPAAIYRTARLVSSLAGGVLPASKAIVGETALPAMRGLANIPGMVAGQPVEVLEAAAIGRPAAGASLPGGLAASDLAGRLALLGVDVQPDQLDAVHGAYRELAARKGAVTVEDVEALISGLPASLTEHYELAGFHIATGTSVPPAATVRLRTGPGTVREASAEGDGPVDAMYRAVDRLTGIPVTLLDYSLNAATSGRDALGQVAVKVLYKGQVFTGRGVSTDVLGASLRAYLHALNKVAVARGKANDFSASPH